MITDANTGDVLAQMVDRQAGRKDLKGATNARNDVEQAFQNQGSAKNNLVFCILFSGHLCPLFTRRILGVVQATPVVQLDQTDQT